MANYYPDRAQRQGRGGWAVIICRVKSDGRVTGCRIGAEGPEGYEFGKAAIRLSSFFRMTPLKDGDALGALPIVVIPIRWGLDGETSPPSYAPGDPALIPSIASGSEPEGRTFACPTATHEQRRCLSHWFHWAERPSIHEVEALVRSAAGELTLMECLVGQTGELSECKVGPGQTAAVNAELLGLAPGFRASPVTEDNIATAGHRALIAFDWKNMRRYLDVHASVSGR